MLHVKMQKEIKRVFTVGYKWKKGAKSKFLKKNFRQCPGPLKPLRSNFFQKTLILALCAAALNFPLYDFSPLWLSKMV